MYGLTLYRWTVFSMFAAASLAQAATYNVSSQSSCEAVPGATWSASSVCSLGANLTLAGADSLTVASSATVAIPAGVTLINNGNVVVEGLLENRGIINQPVTSSFLTVERTGTLRNFGGLVNAGGADVLNKGRTENSGAISNSGTVENHCGVFVNTGTFSGFPLISPHCWVGGASGLWNVAANWSSGVVPSAGAYAVIPSGTATLNVNMNFLGTLLIEGGHLVIAPGVTFTNFSFVSLAAGAPGSSTLRNQGTFANRSPMENSNQLINEGTFNNFSTIRAGSAVGTLVNSGTWTNTGSGSVSTQGIDNAASGVMANNGSMQLTLGQSFNAGALTNASAAFFTIDGKLRNRAGGSIVNQGTVTVNHRLALPGGIDNEAGARVENRAGASISITSAAAYVNNAGLVRNDGAVVNRGIFNNTGVVCGTGTVSGTPVAGNPPTTACVAIANAGADQSVPEGTLVTLNGTASIGTSLSYSWAQTAGPTVVLDTANPARPTFTAPFVSSTTVLSFRLVVNDGVSPSAADFVDVTVTSTNSPPVADAGDDRTARAGTVVTLDSSHSFDPDGTAIASYEWTQVSGPAVSLVPGPSSPNPSFTAPATASTLVFKLRVSDGQESSALSAGADPAQADTVAVTIVENSRPVAVAGPDRSVAENSLVLLDGGASHDSDAGDVLSYEWRQVAGPPVALNNATSATASFTAPSVDAGGATLTFELVVRDNDAVNSLSSVPAVANISVYNLNDPPRCSLAAANASFIWPPDSKMSTVSIVNVLDDDASGLQLTLRITGVRQDEPVGDKHGDPSPDAVIVPGGNTGHDMVQLRRQRLGDGNGRVYTIAFTANDGLAGCSGTVKVEVPHDRSGKPAVDDGPLYDSTVGK